MSSLFGFFSSNVLGIKAQESALSNISDNISNVSTIGFKRTDTNFSSLVLNGNVAGVTTSDQKTISQPGGTKITNIDTDLRVNGRGMFILNSQRDSEGMMLYSREGAFRKDKYGDLQNTSGAYLMGYRLPYEPAPITMDVKSLEVINIKDLQYRNNPTTRIGITANLKASQKSAVGTEYTLEPEFSKSVDTLISNTSIPEGSGLKFTVNEDSRNSIQLEYGGITSSSNLNVVDMFGAQNVYDSFSALKEGDGFMIKTPSSTSRFSYTDSANPQTEKGEFNNFMSLLSAIKSQEGLRGDITKDGIISISPDNPNDYLDFTNNFDVNKVGRSRTSLESAFGRRQVYDIIHSIDMERQGMFGATPGIGASNQQFTSGVRSGDGILVTTSDGDQYSFFYDPNSLGDNEFNSLSKLADAMDLTDNLSASISNDILSVNPKNSESYITSISNINLQGSNPSNFATNLGMEFDTQFINNVSDGDQIRISFGNYKNIELSPQEELNIEDESLIFGRKVSGSDLAEKDILGLNSSDSTSTAFKESGLTDNDGITIKTSYGEHRFLYDHTGINGFNSIDTLLNNINTDTNSDIEASLQNGTQLVIATKDENSRIKEISSIGGSNFAEKLGIDTDYVPKHGDELTIHSTSGKNYVLKFYGYIGDPDTEQGEFNSIKTLKEAISKISDGNIEITEENSPTDGEEKLFLKTVKPTDPGIADLEDSFGSRMSDYMGISAKQQVIDLTYKDKYVNPQGTVTLPDAKAGEFNNVPTLMKAIKEHSSGILDTDLTNGVLGIDVSDGGSINYIIDRNRTGDSNLASTLGIDCYDIITSLGFQNIDQGSNRFSSLKDISDLVNSRFEQVHASTDDNAVTLATNNPLDRLLIENSNEHTNSSSDLLSLFGLKQPTGLPSYSTLDENLNMASGNVLPHFNGGFVRALDSIGTEHELDLAFLKLESGEWVGELYTPNPEEIENGRNDGLIAYMNLLFDGAGNLQSDKLFSIDKEGNSVETSTNSVQINWTNGSQQSDIEIFYDYENPQPETQEIIDGTTSGKIKQVDTDYSIVAAHNGVPTASLSKISIDESGILSAVFSNGRIQNLYQIPLGLFNNVDGLYNSSKELYQESEKSGPARIAKPSLNGVGKIESDSLEDANVDLMHELSSLVPTEHAYQANSKVMQTINKILDEFNRIFS